MRCVWTNLVFIIIIQRTESEPNPPKWWKLILKTTYPCFPLLSRLDCKYCGVKGLTNIAADHNFWCHLLLWFCINMTMVWTVIIRFSGGLWCYQQCWVMLCHSLYSLLTNMHQPYSSLNSLLCCWLFSLTTISSDQNINILTSSCSNKNGAQGRR